MNYLVGDQTYTISHFDSPHYVLGYLQRDGRVYVADKDVQIVSFVLSEAVIEYQTLVLRGELDEANERLGDIPADQKSKIARFLEGQGYKEEALEVATDSEHRFELALALNKLDIALELARTADAEHKWKIVGDAALQSWNLALAKECFTHARDLGSLLLLYTSSCDAEGLKALAAQADEAGQKNVAFSCLWSIGDVGGCIDLLLATGRVAEAVLFAQTYMPSRASALVKTWKDTLTKAGKSKVARVLGQPPGAEGEGEADAELFPDWEDKLKLEQEGKGRAMKGSETDESAKNLIDVGAETGDVETENEAAAAATVTAVEADSKTEDDDE